MLRVLTVICIVFTFQSDEKTILWNKNYEVSWNDFKGAPNLNVSPVAVTVSGITFGYSIQTTNTKIKSFNCTAQAHFYPEKSWVKLDKATDHILKHEQLHFDITEIHARKLRKAIKTVTLSKDVKKQLDQLHKTINEQLKEAQQAYDTATNHSRNKLKQHHWNDSIAHVLKTLEEFKL